MAIFHERQATTMPGRVAVVRRLPAPFLLLKPVYAGDRGMSTAEYAIGTVAAAAFASLLYGVVTGDSVTQALTSLVERALQASF